MKRAFLIVALPACLSVPDKEKPMCDTTSDCDSSHGEICDDGVCWGNPPDGPFAAVLTPPSSRTNLVSRELPAIAISPDGWMDQLQLEKPVVYSASLGCQAPILCDDAMLYTTITITRPATFPGGPGFRSVVKTRGSSPFNIAVPPPHDGSYATYTITIIPDGRDESGPTTTPAQVLPPLRTQLTIDGNATGKIIELGGMALPTISGVIKNEAGQAQPNYRVVAIGRWDYTSTPTEVSTVDFTGTDGTFQIQLSGGLTPQLELVAKPIITTTRPTLHYTANIAQTGFQNLALQWPQGVGAKSDLMIPVKAVDGNGEVKPARGARVIVSSKVPIMNGSATYDVEATTDDSGLAKLSVLDGSAFVAAGYRISIVPPANATYGVMYDQAFSIQQPVPDKLLKTRVALRGVIYMNGEPVKDMAITAHPSLRFMWSLDSVPQAFLGAIPPSNAVTPDDGAFVLWVDPNLVDTWGFYDLSLEAAEGSTAPSLVIPGVELPRVASQTQVDLPIFDLPKPAYVRAPIVDEKGMLIEGAELKLYQGEDFGSLCTLVSHPPQNCPTAASSALLVGRGTSDENGEARLTLPRALNQP